MTSSWDLCFLRPRGRRRRGIRMRCGCTSIQSSGRAWSEGGRSGCTVTRRIVDIQALEAREPSARGPCHRHRLVITITSAMLSTVAAGSDSNTCAHGLRP